MGCCFPKQKPQLFDNQLSKYRPLNSLTVKHLWPADIIEFIEQNGHIISKIRKTGYNKVKYAYMEIILYRDDVPDQSCLLPKIPTTIFGCIWPGGTYKVTIHYMPWKPVHAYSLHKQTDVDYLLEMGIMEAIDFLGSGIL